MERRWLPLNALRAFEAVGRHGGFTAAAQALLVSQSAVSRHVIGLEELIGVQLFDRRPQHAGLTPAGEKLLPVVTRAFDRIDTALEDIRRDSGAPRPALRVALPPTFAQRLAVPTLRDFRAAHPDITLEVSSAFGVGERKADVEVIYAQPRPSSKVHDLLWMVRLTVLCHPSVAARSGDDLALFLARNELLHVRLDSAPHGYLWRLFLAAIGLAGVDVSRGTGFDTAELAVRYALSGEGLALVDPMLFQDDLATGRLARPFAQSVDDGYGYYLVTHPDDLDRPEVALFRHWLIRRFALPYAGDTPSTR